MPVFRTVKDQQKGSIRLEAIHQPLYDRATITAAGNLSFFQNPAGRSLLETNVTTAGQLSWPKRFSIKAVRQVPAAVTLFADLQSYVDNTFLTIVVGEKSYLTLPAIVITAGCGIEIQQQEADTTAAADISYATLGRPNQQNIYSLIHSIFIPPVQNFNVSLNVGAGVSIGTAFTLHMFLEGELLREIQ